MESDNPSPEAVPHGITGEEKVLADASTHATTPQDALDQQSQTNQQDSPAVPAEEEYPSGARLAILVLALIVTIFLVALDMTIVATAIPRITQEFNSLPDIGWYGSSFFLTISAFAQVWGKAYTYFSLKWVILTAIFIFEVGSLICGVAPNSAALIVGRAITGAGGAGITNGCYIIIAFIAHPDKRPVYIGVLGAVYGFASVVGPLIGGAFTTNVTWRWCFYLNLPVGGASALILLLFFQTPAAAAPRQATWREKLLNMDPLGTILILGSLVSYLLALQVGGTSKAWNSSEVIGLLVGFVVILAVFIFQQAQLGDRAMMMPRLIKKRQTIALLLFNFFLAGAYFNFVYYLPVYFQSIGGFSAIDSSVRNLSLIVSSSVFGIISGISLTKVGYFHVLLLSGAGFATLGAGLLTTLGPNLETGKYVGYQLLLGIGCGLCLQIPVIVGQAFSSPADIPAVTAILLFFQTMGGTIFISAAQSIFANRLIVSLAGNTSGVIPKEVVAVGADQLRAVFSGAQLKDVLDAYIIGLRDAWILGVVTAGLAFLSSFLTGFRSIKQGAQQKSVAPSTDVPSEDNEKTV
ncbi:hypothetical protein ONZ43_g5218 [Nemania bipapillata]|uniref:Uncharacterized protein n=1 Tax=Nemania bipapillata TaxID=110536 RepID=A0ACC2IDB2_9PEZI|nr:hypothetical protein ONZ43_g5218 [Nemania bipapillata]